MNIFDDTAEILVEAKDEGTPEDLNFLEEEASDFLPPEATFWLNDLIGERCGK